MKFRIFRTLLTSVSLLLLRLHVELNKISLFKKGKKILLAGKTRLKNFKVEKAAMKMI